MAGHGSAVDPESIGQVVDGCALLMAADQFDDLIIG
jgi:hypothetical protein